MKWASGMTTTSAECPHHCLAALHSGYIPSKKFSVLCCAPQPCSLSKHLQSDHEVAGFKAASASWLGRWKHRSLVSMMKAFILHQCPDIQCVGCQAASCKVYTIGKCSENTLHWTTECSVAGSAPNSPQCPYINARANWMGFRHIAHAHAAGQLEKLEGAIFEGPISGPRSRDCRVMEPQRRRRAFEPRGRRGGGRGGRRGGEGQCHVTCHVKNGPPKKMVRQTDFRDKIGPLGRYFALKFVRAYAFLSGSNWRHQIDISCLWGFLPADYVRGRQQRGRRAVRWRCETSLLIMFFDLNYI